MPALDLASTEFAPGDLAGVPFPTSEYEARWSRAQSLLLDAGLDALVLTSQRNFEYFTGYRTPAWYIKSRPLIIVVPASGLPFVVASEAHAVEVDAENIIHSLVAYSGFEDAATSALIRGLTERGLARGRLGFELGHEQRLGVPPHEFERLSRALPGRASVTAPRRSGNVELRSRGTRSRICGRPVASPEPHTPVCCRHCARAGRSSMCTERSAGRSLNSAVTGLSI